MAHILLVEDDVQIASFIAKGLQEIGHTVEITNNAEEAQVVIDAIPIALAIVDIMLKGKMNGLEFVETSRKEGFTAPIIFLSARDRTADKVKGFNIGADDYLTKPFSLIELKARVENLLRRISRKEQKSEYAYHGLSINLLTREVVRDGKKIVLQRREFMLLEYFMVNPEQVLGKTMILEHVWGYHFDPHTNVVDVLISRLRSKIDKGFEKPLIQTIRGIGYAIKA